MLISIIIPCYNVEEYIEECIESVLKQTYKNIEIICVDNNSTDQTFLKLKNLQKRYPQIIVLEEKKQGAPSARNTGLAVARGEWVQFLDSDDILLPGKIDAQVSLIKIKKNAGYIVSGFKRQRLNGKVDTIIKLNEDAYIASFICESGNTCSNLWNRDHLLQIGGWDERLKCSQETDLMMRLVLNGSECIYDKTVNTLIRERAGQISKSNPSLRWGQFIDLRAKYIEQLAAQNPQLYRAKYQTLINYIFSSILVLSKYDKAASIKYYFSLPAGKWRPTGDFGVSKMKAWFIKALGLKLFFLLDSFRMKIVRLFG